jgi:DNA-binding transcriptional LysR family regulator
MADIDLRHLQYFVAAAESRSFVRAAKLVNLSQPAITKSIQRMEAWFGHALFERGVELKLTPFGEAMLGDAKRVLGGFDDLRLAASQYGRSWAATLKIGAGPLIAETLAGTAVGRLLGQHPGLQVMIHVDQYTIFPDMLRGRHIDFFIADITELKEAGDLEIRRLPPSRFRWFCRKGHPLAKRKAVPFADVLAYPVVLPEMPVWAREWFAEHLPPSAAASAILPPFHPAAICSHFSTLKSIVRESNAVSALTELALNREAYSRDFAVIDFAGMTPSSNAGIVTLKKRPLSPAAHLLIEEVIAVSERT